MQLLESGTVLRDELTKDDLNFIIGLRIEIPHNKQMDNIVAKLPQLFDYAEKYISMRKDDSCGTLYEGYEKYVQFKELLKKLLGNTTKNPEHCCEAFEYLRDGLQKILEDKNGTN